MRNHPDAYLWETGKGLGSCFHRALSAWAMLQRENSAHGWKIGVGVILNKERERCIHAWLERGGLVISAVSGDLYDRDWFYLRCEVERDTVRLVNPRKILRAHRINRASVQWLLDAWGGHYRVEPGGGVVAA